MRAFGCNLFLVKNASVIIMTPINAKTVWMDQVYSNTQLPAQVNTDQQEATQVRHESTPVNTIPTRVNTNQHDKSTRDNTSLERVNTSPTQVNTNQYQSKSFPDESTWASTSLTLELGINSKLQKYLDARDFINGFSFLVQCLHCTRKLSYLHMFCIRYAFYRHWYDFYIV